VTATTTVYVGDAVVTVDDFAFNPDPVTIPVGGKVVWVRLGGDHSVTADGGSFNQVHSATWTQFIHTFNSAGTFPYYCTQHGGPGGTGMSSSVIVQAPPQPIEGLTADNDSPATVNSQIIFSTTITNGNNITYTWDFGDGNTDPASADVTTTHAYTAPGIFTATVTAVNISSTVTATTTAYVGDAIVEVKNFEYDPQVTNVPSGGTVVWVLAENTISHSVTADDLSFNQPAGNDWPPFVHKFPEVAVAASEAVSITYHCTVHPNMTGTVVIAAGPDPVAGLTATNDSPTQVLTPVSLSADITGGTEVSYTWDFDDGGVGTGITTTHVYTQSGIYTATVTATNATNSLTATTTVLIGDAIVDVRDFEFDPTPVSIPLGGTVIWVLRQGTHGVIADDASFAGPTGSNWAPYVHTFTTAGTFPYHCSVHGPSMAGTVIVSESNQELRMPLLSKKLPQ
jgi:plastocyanin